MNIILGIDASRNRSGGARAYLLGVLGSVDPRDFGIDEVHVWSYKTLLAALPDQPWLKKHNPPNLERSLASQLFWQATQLKSAAEQCGCNILFSTDASTLCRFKPMVVLSQDLLSYEPTVLRNFRFGYSLLRIRALLYVQNAAFRRAAGVIFLTKYAGTLIQRSCGNLERIAIIPHGIDEMFRSIGRLSGWPEDARRPMRIVYVSPVWQFKHQWVVVEAMELLRKKGHNIILELVGGGNRRAEAILNAQIKKSDPRSEFVKRVGCLPYSEIPKRLSTADIFVFASSCENMPNTLLEAMAVGIPIACSDRGPMPEILGEGGVYFDPEDPESIAEAVRKLLADVELRMLLSSTAMGISQRYSWRRTAEETFHYISSVLSESCYRV